MGTITCGRIKSNESERLDFLLGLFIETEVTRVKQRVLRADDELHEVHVVLQVRVKPILSRWERTFEPGFMKSSGEPGLTR